MIKAVKWTRRAQLQVSDWSQPEDRWKKRTAFELDEILRGAKGPSDVRIIQTGYSYMLIGTHRDPYWQQMWERFRNSKQKKKKKAINMRTCIFRVWLAFMTIYEIRALPHAAKLLSGDCMLSIWNVHFSYELSALPCVFLRLCHIGFDFNHQHAYWTYTRSNLH